MIKGEQMSNVLKTSLLAFMLIGFNGCSTSTSDIAVTSAKSEKANLEGYKKYTIIKKSGVNDELKLHNALKGGNIDAKLQAIVRAELNKRGKTEVPTNESDFFVAYMLGADTTAMKIKLNDQAKASLKDVPSAAMVLMLVSSTTGELIGLSTAAGEFKNLPEKEVNERLEYTVKKMLSEL